MKKNIISVLVIRVFLRSNSIDALRVFFEKDGKKRISICYLWKKIKIPEFSYLKFCFKIPKF